MNGTEVQPCQHLTGTAVRTWVSDEIRELETYMRVRENIEQMAPNSPCVPTSLSDWIAHRLAVKEEEYQQGLRQLAIKREGDKAGCREPIQPIFGGKVFPDFFSAVLSQQSIWRPGEVEMPTREPAPWPDKDELDHEGSQRSQSGYSRYPPLPRVPGNATVNWKQRAPVIPFDLDAVGRPTMVDDELAPDTDEVMLALIGNSILQELDA
jgi:hypothetical protein